MINYFCVPYKIPKHDSRSSRLPCGHYSRRDALWLRALLPYLLKGEL